MTLKRYAARRDENERPIVRVLEKCGCLVQPLSITGLPDLLVAYRGKVLLIEIKQPHGKLTAAQRKAALLGWPVTTVYSIAEALALIGAENSREAERTFHCLPEYVQRTVKKWNSR